jgi:hypothetical protein
MDFFTKLGPEIRLLPVPNFGVNSRPKVVIAGILPFYFMALNLVKR